MKPRRREALLDEYEKSGMSGAQFARLTGVKYSSFQNWVARRRKRRASGAEMPGMIAAAAKPGGLHLVEAVVESEPTREPRPALPAPVEAALLIELPGGGRMRVESPVQLRMAAELLAMLAERGCARC
jgi:hypothetical protein